MEDMTMEERVDAAIKAKQAAIETHKVAMTTLKRQVKRLENAVIAGLYDDAMLSAK